MDNKLYKHFKGGEGEWQSEEIIIFDEGYITDVVTRGDNIFVSLSPTFEWKAIKTKKGGS
ncbi:hypothetical protein [Gracilibacillus dipsosauri]|uniref:hypothetical protein n=1 Tax=Gracilibacillus dipsosauri TaxID=178340 RepID=UPI00240A4898